MENYRREYIDGLLSKVSQAGPSSNLSLLLPFLLRVARRVDTNVSSLPKAMQHVAGMSDKEILDAMKVAAKFDLGEDLKALIAYVVSARRNWALRAGETPMLHIAAKYSSKRAVTALLYSGFDVDTTEEDGQTALNICCERGHLGTAEMLLERGARIGDG